MQSEALIKPLPLTDGAFFVSASFLNELMACPRAAQYYALNRRVLAQPSNSLIFGKHLHSALEMHYCLKEFSVDPMQPVAALLTQLFTEQPTEDGDFRNLNWALDIYQHYYSQFEFEVLDMVRSTEPQDCQHCGGVGDVGDSRCPWCQGIGKRHLYCEVPFAFHLHDIDDISIYYHGLIDLPVRIDGKLFVLDFKTTSMLGESFWADKKMSAQQVGYCYAFQRLTGLPVHGFIVRALRTSGCPQYVANGKPNKKGESRTLQSWWADAFPEERFYLGTGEINEWLNNTIERIEEFFWFHKRNFFPQSKPAGCVHKYGKCQYYQVCETFPVEDRAVILNSGLYKDKEVSPELQ